MGWITALKSALVVTVAVPASRAETDPDGVDYGRVMQLTFVVTIVGGAPLVALLSIPASLPTWTARVRFAIGVGAIVWLCTALVVYWIERRRIAAEGIGTDEA